jgi:hypothetical protein
MHSSENQVRKYTDAALRSPAPSQTRQLSGLENTKSRLFAVFVGLENVAKPLNPLQSIRSLESILSKQSE